MAKPSGITWIRPPSKLADAIKRNDRRTLAAIYALAVEYGATMMADARRNAPWTDRTGNARSGLFFAVDGFGLGATGEGGEPGDASVSKSTIRVKDTELVIVLGHTMFYGVYLELSQGGAYAIVWPTIKNNVHGFMSDLRRLLEG